MNKNILVYTFILFSLPSFACKTLASHSFISPLKTNNMTEEKYDKLINMFKTTFSLTFERMGINFKIESPWSEPYYNAFVETEDNNWTLFTYGGLARHPLVTHDGFAMALCHEVGHLLGGVPLTTDLKEIERISVEGQADYYAGSKCFRKIFKEEDNKKVMSKVNVPETIVTKCQSSFSETNQQALCQRSAMAAISLTNLLHDYVNRNIPVKDRINISVDTPDKSVVEKLDYGYASTQCRLDTMFQGAICSADDSIALDRQYDSIGNCSRKNGDIGVRPLCWYKP